MKYQNYQFKDFLMDEGFQKWVLEPDADSELFWRNWIDQHPGQENDIRKAQQAIRELYLAGARKEEAGPKPETASQAVLNPEAQQEVWNRIRQAIAGQEKELPKADAPPAGKVISLLPKAPWLRMAAAVLLLLAAGLGLWLARQNFSPQMLAYETAFGETRALTLPDSSQVFLNANSRLSYPRHWEAGEDREVTLAGEAFFAVRRESEPRKFKVNLREGAAVEVLGTAFTVTDRPSLTRVILSQGKVKVGLTGSRQEQAILAPGDLVEIDRRENRLTRTRVARPENYAAFVRHKIEFNDSPLSEVARVLQDHYGYQVRFIPATLASKRLTSSSPDNRVDLLLFAIEKSFNLQVVRKGRRITVRAMD